MLENAFEKRLKELAVLGIQLKGKVLGEQGDSHQLVGGIRTGLNGSNLILNRLIFKVMVAELLQEKRFFLGAEPLQLFFIQNSCQFFRFQLNGIRKRNEFRMVSFEGTNGD